mmetsp:Transcript_108299/g.305317  ORF Transcript_108299/g.305317 Transcript_108299/m.305317 type:complete len:324 (+) Transcript_108299:278-1249(+)
MPLCTEADRHALLHRVDVQRCRVAAEEEQGVRREECAVPKENLRGLELGVVANPPLVRPMQSLDAATAERPGVQLYLLAARPKRGHLISRILRRIHARDVGVQPGEENGGDCFLRPDLRWLHLILLVLLAETLALQGILEIVPDLTDGLKNLPVEPGLPAERIDRLAFSCLLPPHVRRVYREMVGRRAVLREQFCAMCVLRLRALRVRERRGERRAVRQRRRNRHHRVNAPEQRRQEHHLAQAHIAWQAGEAKANGRCDEPRVVGHGPDLQRICRALALFHRTDRPERVHRLVDSRPRRRVQRLEKAARLQARTEYREHELHE